jgi:DNA-binding beta-propeller fold protein YncE
VGSRRRWIATAAVAAASCCLGASAAPALGLAPQGGLTLLPPPDDCIQGFAGTCGRTDAVSLDFPQEMVTSPDGKNAYTTDFFDDSIAEFKINSAGGLVQLADPNECISDDADGPGGNPPTEPACQAGAGLKSPRGIAISPDGLTVYVVASGEQAISMFARSPSTGALSQLPDPFECLSDDGDGPLGNVDPPFDLACGSGIGLGTPFDVAVSADGDNVYVASFEQTVAAFARDTTAAGAPIGSLTQLSASDACITQVGFNTSCTGVNPGQAIGHGLNGPTGIDVTDDGDNVYVTGVNGDSIAEFARNSDGSLDQLADPNDCLSDDPDGPGGNPPTDTNCAGTFALNAATGLDAAPDGDAVYVASDFSDAVDEFSRDATTGGLSPLTDPNDCLSWDSDFVGPTGANGATPPTDAHCGSASGLNDVVDVTVAPDNKSVYLASSTQGAIVEFSRNQSTEELDQLNEPDDCLGSATTNCAATSNMFGTRALALAPDGSALYAVAPGSGALVAFSRELPPTCNNTARSVTQDTPTVIPLVCVDPNGDPMDRSILAQPTHGTLSGDPDSGAVRYTPAAGYLGPDSFVFNAQDLPPPGQPSNIATLSITVVVPPPPAPPAQPGTSQPGTGQTGTKKKCRRHKKHRRVAAAKKKCKKKKQR